MKESTARRRGRAPSVLTVAEKVRELRRTLKSLITESSRIEEKLRSLDSYYRALKPAARNSGPGAGLRGRGPNVRDVAYEILSARKKPMEIRELAERVCRKKGGEAGENFVQNLGAALHRDSRFKRFGRGVYGKRK